MIKVKISRVYGPRLGYQNCVNSFELYIHLYLFTIVIYKVGSLNDRMFWGEYKGKQELMQRRWFGKPLPYNGGWPHGDLA